MSITDDILNFISWNGYKIHKAYTSIVDDCIRKLVFILDTEPNQEFGLKDLYPIIDGHYSIIKYKAKKCLFSNKIKYKILLEH